MTLIVTATIILIIAFFVLLRRLEERTAAAAAPLLKNTSVRPPRAAARAALAPPAAEAPAAAPEGDEPAPASVREALRENLGRIFSADGNAPAGAGAGMAYEQVPRPVLDDVMTQIGAMKHFRLAHGKLQKLLHDPALQIGSELAGAVTSDPVLAAKILNTVNSPYYGLAQKVDSVGHALLLLGVVRLREILYRNGVLQLFRGEDPAQNRITEALWRHATLASICASHLQSLYPGLDRGTLFTIGLLHDIGKLVTLRWVGAEGYGCPLTLAEEEARFGINHAVIGRLALESWGFSDLMVSLIEHHHLPAGCEADALPLDGQARQYLLVLFLADQLAKLLPVDADPRDVRPLLASYLPLIDRQRFLESSLDGVLLSAVRKSEAFAD